jgi:hypothetical protein
MEVLNLFCLLLFLYFIFSISLFNKICLFISLCSLTNCYIKRLELSKSNNIFVSTFGKMICFGEYIFDIFYDFLKKIEKTNMYIFFYEVLFQFNKYYIEGRNFLINELKKRMNLINEKKNLNNNTFKNDNDMFDFLNELDSELDEKKNN